MYLPAVVFTKILFQWFQMMLTNKQATVYSNLMFTTHHTVSLFQIQCIKKIDCELLLFLPSFMVLFLVGGVELGWRNNV